MIKLLYHSGFITLCYDHNPKISVAKHQIQLTSQSYYMSVDRVLFIVIMQESRMPEFPSHMCLCDYHMGVKETRQSCTCFYNFSEVTYITFTYISLTKQVPWPCLTSKGSRKYNLSICLERKCMKSHLGKHDKNKELSKDIQLGHQLKILATHNDMLIGELWKK